MTLSRRHLLGAAAALPLATPFIARPALAGGHTSGPALPGSQSFTLGEFTVTTLLSGTRPADEPQGIFGMNVDAETFAEVSRENFMSPDSLTFFFTPTLVDTGSEKILFDTGLSPASITAALDSAGVAPGDITHVVLTHMHGDHIGGVAGDDGETFPDAAYLTGRVEFDHWNGTDNEGFQTAVAPLAERMTFLEDGQDVRGGITAVSAFGHTPGHMNYRLSSGGQELILMADTANHFVWSLAHPDWEVRFDADKAAAAEARRKILGMAAADAVPVIGYHMPFPALGYVEAAGEGFRYVPHTYQLL